MKLGHLKRMIEVMEEDHGEGILKQNVLIGRNPKEEADLVTMSVVHDMGNDGKRAGIDRIVLKAEDRP